MKKENTIQSILAISGVLIICFLLFNKKFLLIISLLIIVLGLFSKPLSLKIHWIWTKFAYNLGYIQSCILLFIIFFGVLTPLALFRKFIKKRSITQNLKTNFEYRNHIINKNDFENPW